MKRVAVLADTVAIAPPSPELCLIAGMILSWSKGKPERVARMVSDMRVFADAQSQLFHVTRLRGAEHDAEVLASMAQATAWLDTLEPFLIMMSRR